MLYLKLLSISIIVCFIVDLSGAINSLKHFILQYIFKINTSKTDALVLKPFDCSLCMIFWTTLAYLIFTNNISIFNILFISILSYLSSNITGFLNIVKEIFTKIENTILNLLWNRKDLLKNN